MMQQIQKEQEILSHNLKNHLLILDGMVRQGDTENAGAYISQLRAPLDHLTPDVWTGTPTLDVLLNHTKGRTKRAGIRFTIQADALNLYPMEDQDICSLFSNLLDNAFEECMNNKAEHNTINLCICQINNFNIINLTNTCYTPPQLNHNRYLSTKAGHSGIGMINVENTVKKYNGSFMSEFKDHLFTTQITFTQML